MESVEHDGNGAAEALPPPPPVPPNIVPLQAEPEHVPEPVKKRLFVFQQVDVAWDRRGKRFPF